MMAQEGSTSLKWAVYERLEQRRNCVRGKCGKHVKCKLREMEARQKVAAEKEEDERRKASRGDLKETLKWDRAEKTQTQVMLRKCFSSFRTQLRWFLSRAS
jgi:hypothetical protein